MFWKINKNYSENIAERFTAKLLKSVLQKYSEVLCKNIERRFAKLLRGVLYSDTKMKNFLVKTHPVNTRHRFNVCKTSSNRQLLRAKSLSNDTQHEKGNMCIYREAK